MGDPEQEPTGLANQRHPTVGEINAEKGFHAEAIGAQGFEEVWQRGDK